MSRELHRHVSKKAKVDREVSEVRRKAESGRADAVVSGGPISFPIADDSANGSEGPRPGSSPRPRPGPIGPHLSPLLRRCIRVAARSADTHDGCFSVTSSVERGRRDAFKDGLPVRQRLH